MTMTKAQELCNAATIVLPTVALACRRGHGPLLLGAAMHMPASVAYHLRAAHQDRLADRIDNDLRRLDQSLQHVGAALYTHAMAPPKAYTAAAALFNARSIYELWDARTSNDRRRWVNVALAVGLYVAPACARGHWAPLWTILPAGLCFLAGGWGHALFHVGLAAHVWVL